MESPRGRMLVLGGSGFLGARVVAHACAQGLATTSVSREPAPASPGAPPAGLRSVRADALREGEWEAVLEQERPTRVVLCTALARGADCDAYPALAGALNGALPGRVARWCATHGARLVHVSTDLVFGGDPPSPLGYREEDPPAPLSRYGATKAEGERAVLAADPRALVVRLPLLLGDSGGRGKGASDSLIAALERGEQPLLFEDEWRTPLDVDDAAAALVELALGATCGLLHVAGPERMQRVQLGQLVLAARAAAGAPLPGRLRVGTRAEAGLARHRPRDVALDATRARALLRTRLRAPAEALDARRAGAS